MGKLTDYCVLHDRSARRTNAGQTGGEVSMDAQRRAFMEEYDGFRVDVPEGSHELYVVQRRTMTERDAIVANAILTVIIRGFNMSFPKRV